MTGPRIVSLLPSATEISVALGCEAQLFGRSHECDFPPAVQALPVCTATKLAKGLASIEIENRVQAIVSQGLSCYEVDAPLLRSLRPDLILTQTACAICAVTPRDLEEALNEWSGSAPTLLSFAPDRLVDVWGDLRAAGALLDLEGRADLLVDQLQARLDAISRKTRLGARPTVAAIEWVEPLMAAGNWVPELIETAGGQSLFAAIGQHSPWLEWDQLCAADPEVIVLMPCGFSIARAAQDVLSLEKDPRWLGLSAVQRGRVYIVDGHHYFNRPGPRLVESAEMLAEILHPDLFDFGHKGLGWIRMGE